MLSAEEEDGKLASGLAAALVGGRLLASATYPALWFSVPVSLISAAGFGYSGQRLSQHDSRLGYRVAAVSSLLLSVSAVMRASSKRGRAIVGVPLFLLSSVPGAFFTTRWVQHLPKQ